jgi:SMI1 / KNR4 family (SUKH-1)
MKNQTFQDLLRELEMTWKAQDAGIVNKLMPGYIISENKIDCCNYDLPDDMIELYKWKNGIIDSYKREGVGALWMFPMGMMLSIKEICIIQRSMTQDETGWESSKLPLFESGGGEFFLIETGKSEPTYGRIYYHSIGAIDFKKIIDIYDSLYTLFMTILQCFQMKILQYEKETSYLSNSDFTAFLKVGKQNNPLSSYWNLYEV